MGIVVIDSRINTYVKINMLEGLDIRNSSKHLQQYGVKYGHLHKFSIFLAYQLARDTVFFFVNAVRNRFGSRYPTGCASCNICRLNLIG